MDVRIQPTPPVAYRNAVPYLAVAAGPVFSCQRFLVGGLAQRVGKRTTSRSEERSRDHHEHGTGNTWPGETQPFRVPSPSDLAHSKSERLNPFTIQGHPQQLDLWWPCNNICCVQSLKDRRVSRFNLLVEWTRDEADEARL